MAPRWSAPDEKQTGTAREAAGEQPGIHAIVVPEHSAQLLDGMSDYGD